MTETIEEAVKLILNYTHASGGLQVRIPPLVYASLARGGKSTFLILLFDRLKVEGFAPIFISFLSRVVRPGETASQMLNRYIALQMCDPVSGECAANAVVDELELYAHIDRTSEGRGVILLIDELNKLGLPLDAVAAQSLKDYWLDRSNRFMVFTSHVPLDLDASSQTGVVARSPRASSVLSSGPGPSSSRTIVTVKHPRCLDPGTLSEMFLPSLVSVTPAEVSLYGGIPSLVYSAKTEPRSLQMRFAERGLLVRDSQEATVVQVLQKFITAVLTGQQQMYIGSFYEFGVVPAPGEIQWPIFYLQQILDLFPDGRNLKLADLIERDLTTYASRTGSGLDWELIVQVAILMQCLDAKVNEGSGPFDIVASGEQVFRIETFQLAHTVVDAEQANKVLDDFIYRCQRGTIVVATPGFVSFPVVDGFVYFKESNENVRKIAYQVKLGRAYPADAVPSFLESGILVRGKPPSKSAERGRWKYHSDSQIDRLLGASLRDLKPAAWPEHPLVDDLV